MAVTDPLQRPVIMGAASAALPRHDDADGGLTPAADRHLTIIPLLQLARLYSAAFPIVIVISKPYDPSYVRYTSGPGTILGVSCTPAKALLWTALRIYVPLRMRAYDI